MAFIILFTGDLEEAGIKSKWWPNQNKIEQQYQNVKQNWKIMTCINLNFLI